MPLLVSWGCVGGTYNSVCCKCKIESTFTLLFPLLFQCCMADVIVQSRNARAKPDPVIWTALLFQDSTPSNTDNL